MKLQSLKQRVELKDWKDAVYALGCEMCGVHNVGEMGQLYCDKETALRGVKDRKSMNITYDNLKNNKGTRYIG